MEGRTGSFDNGVIDRFQVEVNSWAYRKLSRVTAVSIVLDLEIRSKSGIQFEMRINFR